MIVPIPTSSSLVYPDSDGKPMADNTLQFEWITLIKGNLDALFHDRPDLFVAGDLLWYPVEGQPEVRVAPDVLVAFGRPKGYRGSYQQWLEGGIAPQVVFEVLSPSNTVQEMADKLAFYDEHGVEEYYLYDPDSERLSVYARGQEALRRLRIGTHHVSPRLGIRFELGSGKLVICHPDGQRFCSLPEVVADRDQVRQLADEAKRQTDQARQRAERLAERLRVLGVDPDA